MRSKDKGLMEKIKAFAEGYAMEHGGATPSTRDIGGEFGISHVSAYFNAFSSCYVSFSERLIAPGGEDNDPVRK